MPSSKTAAKPAGPRRPGSRGNLTISFGLVNVNVAMMPLVSERRAASAKTLCADHQEPVKIAWRCETGDHIAGETIKGYPHPDGAGFVFVDDTVLDELVAERTKRVEISRVVFADQIDPIYLGKTYLLWPQEGNDRPFDLFATALRRDGRAAVGTAVLSKQTQLIVIRWSEATDCLVAHVCHFDEAVRWPDIATARDLQGDVDDAELEQAGMLLAAIAGEFDPREVEDTYTLALDEAIAAAAGRKQQPKATPKQEAKPLATDLMAALQASVQAAAKPKTAVATPKRTRAAA